MQSKDDIPNTDIGFWLEYYVEVNERSETHCVEIYFLNLQSYLLNIAIIFANHPFSTKLDTQQQTTKHLLFDNAAALSFYAIQASLTLSHRPIIYQGNIAKESASFSAQSKAKRGGDVAIKTCDVEVAQSEPIECRRLPACVFWGPCAVQVSMLHVNMMLFSYSTSCTARLKASLYTLTPSRKFSLSRQSVTCCLCQIQGDKEKLLYELDSVQAELEKCRMISER